MRSAASQATPARRLAEIERVWEKLTAEQQEHVVGIVRGLAGEEK